MIETLKGNVLKAVYIAEKDAKIYFFKGPNITFGLLFPAIIYLAFSVGRTADVSLIIPGLVAMSSLFGAGAIESIALPLERAKGTFDRLLVAPISLTTIIIGKALGGFFFGIFLSIAYMIIALLIFSWSCHRKPLTLRFRNCTLCLGILSFRRVHLSAIWRRATSNASSNSYPHSNGLSRRRIHPDCYNAQLSSVSGTLASSHIRR